MAAQLLAWAAGTGDGRAAAAGEAAAAAAVQAAVQAAVMAAAAAQLVQILVGRRRGDRYWSCRRPEPPRQAASLPISLVSFRAGWTWSWPSSVETAHSISRARAHHTHWSGILCVLKNVWRALAGVVRFHALYRSSACWVRSFDNPIR